MKNLFIALAIFITFATSAQVTTMNRAKITNAPMQTTWDRVLVQDPVSREVGYILKSSLQGDFIPRSGTDEGAPVTGNVVLQGDASFIFEGEGVFGSLGSTGFYASDDDEYILALEYTESGLGSQLILGSAATNVTDRVPQDGGIGVFEMLKPLTNGTYVATVNGIAPDVAGNVVIASGGTVQSVTGSSVDNTDPNNPIIPHIVQSVTGTAVSGTADNPVINTPEINLAFIQDDIAGLRLYTNTSSFQLTLPMPGDNGSEGPGLMSYADKLKLDAIPSGGGAGTVTSVTSTTADISITNNTSTPSITLNSGSGANQVVKRNASGTIDDLAMYATTTYADGKVAQTITNGVTITSPSQDAVYDALVLKADANNVVVSVAGLNGTITTESLRMALGVSTDVTKDLVSDHTDKISTTGISTQQVLSSVPIGQASGIRTIKPDSFLNVRTRFGKSGNQNAVDIKFYISTVAGTPGQPLPAQAQQVGRYNMSAATLNVSGWQREFNINASSLLEGMNANLSGLTDIMIGNSNPIAIQLTLPQQYNFITAVEVASPATETITQKSIHITSSK